MARKVINVVYKVDDKELVKAKTSIQGVEKETKDAEKEMLKLDKAVQKTGRDGQAEMSKLSSVIGAISFAAIAAGVVALGKKILDLGIKQEQLNIAFTTFLGSAEKAKKVIADLTRFSIVTPFTPDQVNSAAKALLAFGVQGEELIPTLKMLGDVSSGTGKDLTEMAIIFGQIRSTGRLMGQDLLQLINAGFNPLQVISQKTGKSVKTLKEEMEKGLISFEMVSEAFKVATSEGGLFFNLMEKQSASVGGKLSTVAGNVEEIEKALFSANNGALTDFINILVKITSNTDKASKFLNGLFDVLITNNFILMPMLKALDLIGDSLDKDAKAAFAAQKAFNELNNEFITSTAQSLVKDYGDDLESINKALKDYEGLAPVEITQKMANETAILAEVENILAGRIKEVTKETDKLTDAEKRQLDIINKKLSARDKDLNLMGDWYKSLQSFTNDEIEQVKDNGDREIRLRKELTDERIKQEKEAAEKIAKIKQDAADREAQIQQDAAELSIRIAYQLGAELLSNFLLENTISTDALRDKYDTELELAGDNERAKKEIQIRQKDELRKIEEENKQIQKRNAIRSILIDTAVSIIKTFAQFGYPAGVLPAALMGAIGVAASANVRKYKKGEVNIDGIGTGTSDSIPAMISKGESVINAQATSKSMNLLEAINDRKIDDSILYKLTTNGGRQTNFDDSGIIKAIERNKVDYLTQGYSLYQATQVGKNFKRTIRSKVQGY